MTLLFILAQLAIADRLYDANYFPQAELEYRRVLFYNQSPDSLFYTRKKLFYSLYHNEKFEAAVKIIKELIEEDSLHRDNHSLLLSKLYVNAGYYSLARLELNNLSANTKDKKIREEAIRLSGIANIYRRDYQAAEENFREISDTLAILKIRDYIGKPKKNIFKAMLLSSILPGSGELYAGNLRLAAIDFSINFASGFLLYNALKKKKTFDAALIVSFLIARFYTGSRSNAQTSAIEFNERQHAEWLTEIEKDFQSDLELK